ncbi:MAG TPA: HEAT repeat domain-containing protein [Vulgatibacter sp.]
MFRDWGQSVSPVLAVSTAAVLVSLLAAAVVAFAAFAAGISGDGPLRALLLGNAAAALGAGVTLAAFLRSPRSDTAKVDSSDEEVVESWCGWWREGILGRTDDPPGALPPVAIEAYLRVRDSCGEAAGAALDQLGIRFGVARALKERLLAANGPEAALALEDVGRGRISGALDRVFGFLPERGAEQPSLFDLRKTGVHPVVQRAALRAAARILAILPPKSARAGCDRLASHLAQARLSPEVTAEVILLLEDAARAIVPALLQERELPGPNLRGVLHAAGRLRLTSALHQVLALTSHDDAEVRAAALRALRAIGEVPPAGEVSLRATMRDEQAFVRVHATRAAGLLPQGTAIDVLWGRLGDSSWWVRLAAAETLHGLGPAGAASILAASEHHPDPFARDMARQFASAGGGRSGKWD